MSLLKAKLLIKFLGNDKTLILDSNKSRQYVKALVMMNDTTTNVRIDNIENIWPTKPIHDALNEQYSKSEITIFQAQYHGKMFSIIRLGGTENERSVPQYQTLIENVNVNQNFGLLDIRRQGHRDLVRIKLVKVSHQGDDFFMRLATNLTTFIHHDGKYVCIGEVDFMIPHENKIWILNPDKSISPRSNPSQVIGVRDIDKDPEQSLVLMDSEGEGETNRLLFKMLEQIPDYVDFKREFRFGSNVVRLE